MIAFFGLGCSGSDASLDVSFFGTRGSALHLIYDTQKTGLLGSGNEQVVKLKTPGKFINPGVALARNGDFLVSTDQKNHLSTFAKTVYKNADLPDGKITLNAFVHLGDEQVFTGSDFKSNIWVVKKDQKPVKLAQMAYKTYKIPHQDGKERSILMRKGVITGDKWVGDIGGRLYEENDNGELVQIGFVEWRLLTLEDGKNMTIMMIKDMKKNALWKGRYNGKIYIAGE